MFVVNTPLYNLKVTQKCKIVSREVHCFFEWLYRVQWCGERLHVSWYVETVHCPVVESALWATTIPGIVTCRACGARASNAVYVCCLLANNALHGVPKFF